MKYSVLVNGEQRTVDVPERMPLLWVLRDTLDLKGTKFGCGMAQCGACTVLLDGQPIRSCVTPISSVGKGAVTTERYVDGPYTFEILTGISHWIPEEAPEALARAILDRIASS